MAGGLTKPLILLLAVLIAHRIVGLGSGRNITSALVDNGNFPRNALLYQALLRLLIFLSSKLPSKVHSFTSSKSAARRAPPLLNIFAACSLAPPAAERVHVYVTG
jgi:hypothetical protein